jgi:large-conductance mechanosensitive channel
MTKHITLILILANLLTSCQRRELVDNNLSNMRTEESRPAAVIKQGNMLDAIWKAGLTAAVVFLLYKNHKSNKKMHYLNKVNRRLQTAYDNFVHMFGFHQEDDNTLNNVHVQV